MRKRLATYVVLIVLLVVMALIYLLTGWAVSTTPGDDLGELFAFPDAYATIGSFVFGLGSLLAVAYAAAVGGGDWIWGVPRLLIARGESRSRYVIAKALALAGILAIGVVIAFAAGMAFNLIAAAMAGVDAGNPLADDGPAELGRALLLGYPVVLERAFIGFAVAMVLRSQLAGVVIGILLYIGEGILVTLLLIVTLAARGLGGLGGLLGGDPIGPEWFQYLPFTIGDSVLTPDPGAVPGGGLEDLILRQVPLEQALIGVFLYGALSLVVAAVFVERAEITA
jgi:ABC-type transport system involved in multi-copper enzyme maturation permease subunit